MIQKVKEWSPKVNARLAGVFEALEGFTSTFGQVTVLGKLIVFGNAAATAANVLKHETLFRLGFGSRRTLESAGCPEPMKTKRFLKWSALAILLLLFAWCEFAYWSSTNDCNRNIPPGASG